MSASEAQIRANRDNAQKSTGPKTEAGKARARMNALKHGMRSKSPIVLPHEDPAELDARLRTWVEEWQPQNAIERELVERAAKASWALERAERYEAALLSKQVRGAMSRSRAKRTAKVGELGRRLFTFVTRLSYGKPDPSRGDDPAAIVAALEDSPEGVRWLLDRWGEALGIIDGDHECNYTDVYKFIRLQGKQPYDAVDDPGSNAAFLAWEVLDEDLGADFWEKMQNMEPFAAPVFYKCREWRELAPPPADEEEARATLRAIVAGEVERLNERLAELEEADGEDALERAEAASFLPGDAGEQLRRYQSARSRELFRAIQLLSKLRKDAASNEPRKRAAAPAAESATIPLVGEGGRGPDEGGHDQPTVETVQDVNIGTSEEILPSPLVGEGGRRPDEGDLQGRRRSSRRPSTVMTIAADEATANPRNATNEPNEMEIEELMLKEVKTIVAEILGGKRTRPRAAAG